ncbi:cobalt transporter CbiM [Desulfovibrio piger]|uniref:Cobalamin biosynthesis protein CbiM n=1 Tax=Desulfovibrio piger ATCC 29098 TaxID=411464 RepID=B6WRX4_9BACT|nr:cobalt transporter CbiM [Desulfovibrio piger]EEB34132.1 cobalamin biosynthesis protein CbiM [Desulfovibrio piger ATCC 29098]MDY3879512.1 cobalt transporter CbiM [Desulfovibrio piger]OLA83017.1 MAG: cobalamin biosynthesis protein CbiM [Desulfovibrio piger]HCZ44592.1 cobalt transporter CbiM [Desulfovibrio piger]
MHIAEGVLSPAVLAGGAVLALAGTALGLRKLEYDRLVAVGILSAAFFVASLIHVPVGLSSAHLVLNGLVGVLLGWAAFPSILVALLLQALLFQFGGITVLGVNVFTMGFAAVISWYVFRAICYLCPGMKGVRVAAFMGGALGVALAAVLTALALAFTDEGFWLAARLLLLAHLPVMLVEGLVTMFTVSFIMRVRPELLGVAPVRPGSGQEGA